MHDRQMMRERSSVNEKFASLYSVMDNKFQSALFYFAEHACTEFRCNLREFCIAMDLVCDGINHCADGSDESSSTLCQSESFFPRPPIFFRFDESFIVADNENGTILGMEVTWFVVAVVSTLLVLLVCIVAISICLCRRGLNTRSNNVQQQNTSYSRKRRLCRFSFRPNFNPHRSTDFFLFQFSRCTGPTEQ